MSSSAINAQHVGSAAPSDAVASAFEAALGSPSTAGVLPSEGALQAPPVNHGDSVAARSEHHRSMRLDTSSPLFPRPGSWFLVALEDGSLVSPGWRGWDLGVPYPPRSSGQPARGPRAVALVTGWMCDACVRCGACGGRVNGEGQAEDFEVDEGGEVHDEGQDREEGGEREAALHAADSTGVSSAASATSDEDTDGGKIIDISS